MNITITNAIKNQIIELFQNNLSPDDFFKIKFEKSEDTYIITNDDEELILPKYSLMKIPFFNNLFHSNNNNEIYNKLNLNKMGITLDSFIYTFKNILKSELKMISIDEFIDISYCCESLLIFSDKNLRKSIDFQLLINLGENIKNLNIEEFEY